MGEPLMEWRTCGKQCKGPMHMNENCNHKEERGSWSGSWSSSHGIVEQQDMRKTQPWCHPSCMQQVHILISQEQQETLENREQRLVVPLNTNTSLQFQTYRNFVVIIILRSKNKEFPRANKLFTTENQTVLLMEGS